MRIPLEYGDNFPVPSGFWRPTVPWRFPNHEMFPKKENGFTRLLPWVTLGLGVTLGILWMNWHLEGMQPLPSVQPPVQVSPSGHSARPSRPVPVRFAAWKA